MQAFVPKSRRLKFDLNLRIIDLNNVPLVSGTSFVKWHLPHSASAEHRGRTSKFHIRDHKVCYEYEKTVPVRLNVDKANVLQELDIHFEVLQEYSYGARGERIVLGKLKLNLAEYVEASEMEAESGIIRRYLMQDSKINSTLKIAVRMTLTEGDRNFIAPALRTAPVFGGIAGIMAGDQGEVEDPGQATSLTNKSREAGEVQDMYRRNLAASWTAQPGELRADECIEDIFAGGDGWGKNGHSQGYTEKQRGHRSRASMDQAESKQRNNHRHHGSKESLLGGDTTPRQSRFPLHMRSTGSRTSLDQHSNSMQLDSGNKSSGSNLEVDEFELREDLRSWKLTSTSA